MLTSLSSRINTLLLVLLLLMAASIIAILASRAGAGPLDPPGPPGSTLPQVEPRTPISSLPFTITQPGSYFVTKNLTGTAGTDGITVQADNVTIDLNGFTMTSGPSGAAAISQGAASPAREHWTIKNGTFDGWQYGVNAPQLSDAHFFDLIINGTSQRGIEAGGAIMIERVTSHGNSGQFGLDLGAAAQLSDCFVDGNSLVILIQTTDQATITRCSTVGGGAGIQTGPASKVDQVDVRFATTVGISAGPGSSVTSSTIGGIGAGGWAIAAHGNGRVTDNVIDTGGDKGVDLFGSSEQVARNQIQHVTWGVYFEGGSSNNIAYANVFRDIAPANVFADLGTSNQYQAAVGVTSAPNAWANIAY